MVSIGPEMASAGVKSMRIASVTAILSVLTFLGASLPADAQNSPNNRKRPQLTVQKRSYLDAGTTVKPGDMRYHDYIYSPALLYPPYGPRTYPYAAAARWPLPSFGDVPGY
jgi:hypothetical protein